MSSLLDASSAAWLQVLGRAHVLVLHLPIGLLVALLLLEAWGWLTKRPPEARRVLASAVAVSAMAAAATGWLLAEEPGRGGQTLDFHRWLGVGLAAVSCAMAVAALLALAGTYKRTLALAAVLLAPAAHLGGSMTHGEDWLTEPLSPLGAVTSAPGAGWYQGTIAPLLEARCGACHGETRARGGLALHTREALLAGGDSGAVLVPGDATVSAMVIRTSLPLEHDDHMPPAAKRQPSEAERDELAAWIAAGAPFDATRRPAERPPLESTEPGDVVGFEAAPPTHGSGPAGVQQAGTGDAPVFATTEALAALADAGALVETLDPASGALWVRFGNSCPLTDEQISALLAPASSALAQLILSGTAAGARCVAAAATSPRLELLDLSRTPVVSVELAPLQGHAKLARLRLNGTAVDDGALPVLESLPALQQLAAWDSALSAQARARLIEHRPALGPSLGAEIGGAALESEPAVELGPAPGQDS